MAGKRNKKRKEHYVSTQSSEGYQRWRVGWGEDGRDNCESLSPKEGREALMGRDDQFEMEKGAVITISCFS